MFLAVGSLTDSYTEGIWALSILQHVVKETKKSLEGSCVLSVLLCVLELDSQ